MNRFVAIIMTVYSPTLLAQTPTESVSTYEHNIVEYRFVGLTSDTGGGIGTIRYTDDSGDTIVGVAAMHRLCQESFGNEARAATIQEAYFRNEQHLDNEKSWEEQYAYVAPAGPISILEAGDGQFVAIDASTGTTVGGSASSEAEAMKSAYCSRYTGSDQSYPPDDEYLYLQAPASQADGQVIVVQCDRRRPIACSIPVRITATGLTKVTNGRFKR